MTGSAYSPPPHTVLDVVFADACILVINKPSGLLTVPGRGPLKDDCLASRVQAIYPDALIVHRLDMETSGLVLMARGAAIQKAMSVAFMQRAVDKEYVAVVAGCMLPLEGTIDLPLIADWPNRPRQKVDFEFGKPSLTHYRVIEHDARQAITRVQLTPVTGRSHQLRVHMYSQGHPILGDGLYGTGSSQTTAKRLLLHASMLRITHPVENTPMTFTSKVPF